MGHSDSEFPRRIILSRKGFDLKYGGCASPILPDGTLFSLPIPEIGHPTGRTICYGELPFPGFPNLGEVLTRLPTCNVHAKSKVHLDPDLRPDLHIEGVPDWRGLFGQADAAQGHLHNMGVCKGDLFLFFGWFRKRDLKEPKSTRYEASTHDEHVIWGWLQIGGEIDPSKEVPPWAKHHPHAYPDPNWRNNRIYVASEKLSFAPQIPGAGVFQKYDERLRLTHPLEARRRTKWRLPESIWPLTYHPNVEWKIDGEYRTFKSASIGQEFVFDATNGKKKASEWLREIFHSEVAGSK